MPCRHNDLATIYQSSTSPLKNVHDCDGSRDDRNALNFFAMDGRSQEEICCWIRGRIGSIYSSNGKSRVYRWTQLLISELRENVQAIHGRVGNVGLGEYGLNVHEQRMSSRRLLQSISFMAKRYVN